MSFIKLIIFIGCSMLLFGCHEVISVPEQENNNSRYEPDIIITSPLQGEEWRPGNTYNIKWTSASNISNVNIIVIKKQQYHKILIANRAENSGSFVWTVPEDIVKSVHYQIGIEDSGNPGEYFYSKVFEITNR